MSEAQNESIAAFIARLGITAAVEAADSNPHLLRDKSDKMIWDHWRVTFTRKGDRRHTLTTYFSKGPGHHGTPPTADEVLDCLASDASGAVNARDFEDWCGEYGYNTDSREAERTYKVIQEQSKRLRRFIGAEFDKLLFETERL